MSVEAVSKNKQVSLIPDQGKVDLFKAVHKLSKSCTEVISGCEYLVAKSNTDQAVERLMLKVNLDLFDAHAIATRDKIKNGTSKMEKDEYDLIIRNTYAALAEESIAVIKGPRRFGGINAAAEKWVRMIEEGTREVLTRIHAHFKEWNDYSPKKPKEANEQKTFDIFGGLDPNLVINDLTEQDTRDAQEVFANEQSSQYS